MIDLETHARIRRLFYVEHWKIGTIVRELGLHHDTVSRAVGDPEHVGKFSAQKLGGLIRARTEQNGRSGKG